MLGEYDAAGKALQETIYLDGVPILVVKYLITSLNGVSTTQTALFYIFADHLDAPRVITRATDNKIVWRWDNSDPFGLLPPNENPSSLGTFSYNPRFKGSLFDFESKLFYNYFRDYDPQIGRYVQSDPIGLDGGMNTYGYAMGNPMSFNDPTGLQTRPLRGPGNIPFLPLSKEAMEAVNRAYANEKAREDKISFQTYTRYNQITGQCYGGRTSGTGTPEQNVRERGWGQPMLNAEGFDAPVLDRSSPNYYAIRGREQQMIDINGGAKSDQGTSRNAIRGVSKLNPARFFYEAHALYQFGAPVRSGSPCTCPL